MDIAIQFEKFNLDEDKWIFKPITIIRGDYYEEQDFFVNESGYPCSSIFSQDMDTNDYFGYPTTIEDLRNVYGNEADDQALLANYFDMCMDNCYIGMYNDDGTANVVTLPIYEIAERLDQMKLEEEESTVSFDKKTLQTIRDSKSLEDVKKILDPILNILNNAEKEMNLEEMQKSFATINKQEKKFKVDKKVSKKFDLAKLRKEVSSQIIAQEEAVKSVTTTIAVNSTSKNPKHKSHILIAGPSGTGKTEIINIVSKYLDIPYFKADATAYTKEGYVGKSVYSMLNGLLDAADGDLEKAQNGILVIDEIDKKAFGSNEDVSGHAVLHSLLKIMDRDVIEIDTGHYSTESFDTSNLTIIFMGAFEEMFRNKKNSKKNKIGFSNEVKENENITIANQDFIDFGMPAEFMGRIGELTYTKELKEKDLLEILRKSKISPLKIEKEYFNDMGIKVTFTSSYLKEIVNKSLKSGTGARNLKKLVHESLIDAYEKPFMKKKVKKMRFTKDTVIDPKKYYVE